ncbi:ribosomal protein S7A, partial [Dimargaris xerosporica]
MSTLAFKIRKPLGSQKITPIEQEVAQALIDLENNSPDIKKDLRPIQIAGVREIPVGAEHKALVIFVPVPVHKQTQKIQQRLVRELEKKFSDRHVVILARRQSVPKPHRNSNVKPRPYSRTRKDVQAKMLEDLVYPVDIVGKRIRTRLNGSKLNKVFLNRKDASSMEYKLGTFSAVYKALTGKDTQFSFKKDLMSLGHPLDSASDLDASLAS